MSQLQQQVWQSMFQSTIHLGVLICCSACLTISKGSPDTNTAARLQASLCSKQYLRRLLRLSQAAAVDLSVCCGFG